MTAFAGSMPFVYIHIAWFGCWIAFGVENYPYGLLTMIVSLEAIFLSTFVMISQNRADAKRQVIADQQWQTVKEEDRQNEELLELSRQTRSRSRSRVIDPRHRGAGAVALLALVAACALVTGVMQIAFALERGASSPSSSSASAARDGEARGAGQRSGSEFGNDRPALRERQPRTEVGDGNVVRPRREDLADAGHEDAVGARPARPGVRRVRRDDSRLARHQRLRAHDRLRRLHARYGHRRVRHRVHRAGQGGARVADPQGPARDHRRRVGLRLARHLGARAPVRDRRIRRRARDPRASPRRSGSRWTAATRRR